MCSCREEGKGEGGVKEKLGDRGDKARGVKERQR